MFDRRTASHGGPASPTPSYLTAPSDSSARGAHSSHGPSFVPATDAGLATAERLRATARELFAERGYAGASLGDICARVGIRKSSVYNYYRSKDHLFLDLLARSLDAWRNACRPALTGEGTHARRLERHLRAAVSFAVARPHASALCRVAVSQVTGDLAAEVDQMLDGHRDDYERVVTRFFASAKAAGEVVDLPTPLLAAGWITFFDGVLSHQIFGVKGRRERYLALLDDLWRLYWRGVAADPASVELAAGPADEGTA